MQKQFQLILEGVDLLARLSVVASNDVVMGEKGLFVYSRVLRCCKAMVSGSRFSPAGPTKGKAQKSLFTETLPCIESKEHLLDFVITFILKFFNALHNSKVSQSTLKLVHGIKMVTGCLRMTKFPIFVVYG